MVFLIITVVIASLWHFIYESTIAPSLRMLYRYKLFELRDQVRKLKIERHEDLKDELFNYLETSLNREIKYLHSINISSLTHAHKLLNGPSLASSVKKREQLIDSCKITEVRAIREKSVRYFAEIFLVNSGGWFVYVIPLIVVIGLFSSLSEFFRKFLSLPESEVESVIPSSSERMLSAA